MICVGNKKAPLLGAILQYCFKFTFECKAEGPHVGPLLWTARRPRLAIPNAAAFGPLAPADFCPENAARSLQGKNPACGRTSLLATLNLFLNVGQKSHKASALYCFFYHALLL